MLFTLIVIIGTKVAMTEQHLTADECFFKGRNILIQNEHIPLIAIECEPEGEET